MKERINKLLKHIKDKNISKEISNEEGLIILDYNSLSNYSDGVLEVDVLISGDPVRTKVFEFNDSSFYIFLLKIINDNK